MIAAATLVKLRQLRERQRDAAQGQVALLRAAFAQFEQQRKGWRARVAAEAQLAGDDPLPLGSWIAASQAQERATAEQAAQLKQGVVAAEAALLAADLAVEQVISLQQQARSAARRAQRERDQRRLDELRPRPRFDDEAG